MKTEIIPFNPDYKSDFKELNVAWLQKYFYVEPRDEEVLGNPEKYIIQPGGHIFSLEQMKKLLGPLL